MYCALNGKVLLMKLDRSESHFDTMKNFFAGKHVEVNYSKLLYDPKYGIKNSID